MMWYEYLGGRKAYQGLVAAGVLVIAYFGQTAEWRGTNFLTFGLLVLAAFGIYTMSNIAEHKIKNGNGVTNNVVGTQ